jgi:MFS family permease
MISSRFDKKKGCVFLISSWYTRFETQKRLAVFYLGSMVISGFANIIGLGITKLGGVGGLAAWRWIFIVFGLATMLLAFIAYFLISAFLVSFLVLIIPLIFAHGRS